MKNTNDVRITNSSGSLMYAENSHIRPMNRTQLRLAPIFVLCERCYWCATFLDNYKLHEKGVGDEDKNCPHCNTVNSLSSLKIMTNG